ncbi:GTP cyclohydrolase FolE2 [Caldisericum exile]|uniref:GTP cyclohydrolase FolE2 n=1 Tax=Caldisericum exile (strain DSM 21853 / NBRC 104410 / AZM16c01) TaxID=511051 RepID=A0A7U6GEJ3_CALEA|nr:GTP cyclohydrolase FolE2 [Caldisericum exile]BAL80942.1 GTP cyclohydrolase folE2 [Caldisericum exile AZM16c01]
MKDVQSEKDKRNIFIEKVGVSSIKYPIRIMDKQNGFQNTVALVDIYVDLPSEYRGTHMSRFVEILNKHRNNMSLSNLEKILDDTKQQLRAKVAHIVLRFPYFILKKAPITKEESFMDYECAFIASKNEKFDFVLEVNVPVHLLCPCSKEISDFGAHNQRANIRVKVKMDRLVWIEEIVEMVENSASAPLYALLKRPDEKYITEKAYMNPKFVEDIVRDVSILFDKDERITYYEIEAISYESIHNHSAYAYLHRDKNSYNK